MKNRSIYILLILMCLCSMNVNAQTGISLEEAISLALKNNPQMHIADLEILGKNEAVKTAYDLPKTNFQYMGGQYNSVNWDNQMMATQNMSFPGVYAQQKKWLKENILLSETNKLLTEKELKLLIRTAYLDIQYFNSKGKILQKLDTLFLKFKVASELKYKTGESNLLEKTTADLLWSEHKQLIMSNNLNLLPAYQHLRNILVRTKNENFIIRDSLLLKISSPNFGILNPNFEKHPLLKISKKQLELSALALRIDKSKLYPDFTFGYFNQSLSGWQTSKTRQDKYYGSNYKFQGLMLGAAVPLFSKSFKSKIKVAQIQTEIAQQNVDLQLSKMQSQFYSAYYDYIKNDSLLMFYEKTAIPHSELIIQQSQKAYQNGAISYFEYSQALTKSIHTQLAYIDAIYQHNLSIYKLMYIEE